MMRTLNIDKTSELFGPWDWDETFELDTAKMPSPHSPSDGWDVLESDGDDLMNLVIQPAPSYSTVQLSPFE